MNKMIQVAKVIRKSDGKWLKSLGWGCCGKWIPTEWTDCKDHAYSVLISANQTSIILKQLGGEGVAVDILVENYEIVNGGCLRR